MRRLRELRYLDVKGGILEEIVRLPPGAPIRPERELAAASGFPRTTVRKAVTELVARTTATRPRGSR